MKKDQKTTSMKATRYASSDLQTVMDAIRKMISESSNKEKILNYLKTRIAEAER